MSFSLSDFTRLEIDRKADRLHEALHVSTDRLKSMLLGLDSPDRELNSTAQCVELLENIWNKTPDYNFQERVALTLFMGMQLQSMRSRGL